MLISEMTMVEFSAGLERTRTVIIPFGSTEEHGDHLPLATDTLHAEVVAGKLSGKRPLFVAPAIPYGVCRSSDDHPGTVSIRTETLKMMAIDVVSSLRKNGLRNFILLSGHAGGTHTSSLVDAGEDLLRRFPDIRIAVLTEFQLVSKVAKGIIETAGDAHAGEIETSRILHSHPHLVKGRGRREFPDFPSGILVRHKRKFWPGGVWGNPEAASAAKGRKLEEAVVEALDELVDKLESWRED